VLRSFRVSFVDIPLFLTLPGLKLESLDLYSAGSPDPPLIKPYAGYLSSVKDLFVVGTRSSFILDVVGGWPSLKRLVLWNPTPDIPVNTFSEVRRIFTDRAKDSGPLAITFIAFDNHWDWEIAWQEKEMWDELGAGFEAWVAEEVDEDEVVVTGRGDWKVEGRVL
jgi:hypothetical protein